MKFLEFEKLMLSRGITTLAEMARILNTTPQAVSNWKSRDQVPYHVIIKLETRIDNINSTNKLILNRDKIEDVTLSDIFILLATQIKIIFLTLFISVFTFFGYVQFLQEPVYISTAKILIPDSKSGNIENLTGLASQFGVNVQNNSNQIDLSSTSIFPELISSRTFSEKIFSKEFFTEKYGKKLNLLEIIIGRELSSDDISDTLITKGKRILSSMISFSDDPSSPFSILSISTFEPKFSKDLAEVVLVELENLNRFFKSKTVKEKSSFIENRIISVKDDLENSEKEMKEFVEKNRQLNSPSLRLKQERLARDIDIQKGIYLTLKQQLELVKIEEIQQASIFQILDYPVKPLFPSNKKRKTSIIVGIVIGLIAGIVLALIRSYFNTSNIDEKKKLRKAKNIVINKIKNIFEDKKFLGTVSVVLLLGLPLFLGYRSKNPEYFGLYSRNLLFVNIVYLTTLIFSIFLFLYNFKNKK